MDPNDPIAQSIDFDLAEGMTDPTRAAAIMRILPQLTGSQPNTRPIGDYSGLPQTGGQALADVAAGAGQLPSGIPGDVRMPSLGQIYQNRALMTQRGDIAHNELEGRRVAEENQMTRARAAQGMGALNWAQKDRELSQQIKANERLLAQDGRMRIEFIGEAAKAAGAPDSPEYRAYMDTFMRALRDPSKRAALLDPRTGVESMVAIMDESLQASRARPTTGAPRTDAALGVVQRPDFPTVSPTEQRMRDQVRDTLIADEKGGRVQYDPIESVPEKPTYPTEPTRMQGEGNAAFEKRKSEHAKIVNDMTKEYQASVQKYNEGLIKRREDQAKAEKERIANTEAAVDAKRVYESVTAKVSDALSTAKALRDHKGLNRLVGALDAWTPDLTPDAQNARVIYDNMIGQQVMEALKGLKDQSKTGATGFGALSDRELDLIRVAAGRLARRQSEEQFRKHLNEYIAQLEKTMSGVARDYQSGPWAGKGLPAGVTVREK